jgi:outer membrane protein insertion porin family
MARDPGRDRAYLTGTIDMALGNIYGSGRDLRVGWQRDARLGSRLALGYRERYLFGTPLDFGVDLSQTVRDSSSTWQTLGLVGLLPLNRTLALELGGAFDRSVYHLEPKGNTFRARARVGLRFASLRREEDGARFGVVEVHAEWARRRNDLTTASGEDHARVHQTIWGGRFETGVPLATRHVLAARGEWHVLDGPTPVPDSELYEFGGARTLRGYREAQFRGDRVAFGGIEYRYGNPLGARLYGFVDAGGLGLRQATGLPERSFHLGYGVGLRAAMANGLFDLAFGIGEERSLADAKVHASLSQRF